MCPELIRPKVIGIFRRNSQILVGDSYDHVKNEKFYCPPGGGIEFGETSLEALRREIREELSLEITEPHFLGVVENLFTFEGTQAHEIVLIYSARLTNEDLYTQDCFIGQESNGEEYNAIWIDIKESDPDSPPIYPVGLVELLTD